MRNSDNLSGIRGRAQESLNRASAVLKRHLKSFSEEAEHFERHKWMMMGLVLLPTLVFYLYVGAYYRPLDNMSDTQILVVNMDNTPLSYQIEDSIMQTNLYQFKRATYEYARQGISDGSEWAAIVIPAGFSDRINNGEQAEIWLLADDGRSYVVTRVLSPTFTVLTDRINAAVQESAREKVGRGLREAASQETLTSMQLGGAAGASSKIANGQHGVAAYSSEAAYASSELGYSSALLARSTRDAMMSVDALRSGLVELEGGSGRVTAGLLSLKNGTGQIATAHNTLDGVVNQSLAVAQTLDNSSQKTQLVTLLTAAKTISTAEKAGIAQVDGGAGTLYSGSQQVTSGLSQARYGTGTLEDGLVRAYEAQKLVSSSSFEESNSLSQISEGAEQLAEGQEKLSGGLSALSYKEGKISTALGTAADYTLYPPSVKLVMKESSKTDYGTFFATAFVVLGLFFGAASAYVFSALNMVKRALPYAAAFVLAQALVLLFAYLWMGFPDRAGAEQLFIVLVFVGATFLMMTRAIIYLLGDIFTAEHLQVMSPVLSLLAVFMISSGGAIWPQHTLNPPFSYFAPYIPFNYATMAVRQSALSGAFPAVQIGYLIAFCLIFYAVRKGAVAWRKGKRQAKAAG
ncbi:ABC-2 family transporter protein [uncultured archaeon]|nr:ABC-2 family transporter protein [uncultured archaeon]